MTLSGAQARYQLNAGATPTGTNVVGPNTIGQGLTTKNYTAADIVHSFKVTATGSADVATLTLSSGAVAQTTGTPTITDGDGNDFEGVAIPTAATIYGLLFTAGSADAGTTEVASSADTFPTGDLELGGSMLFTPSTQGSGVVPGAITIALTLAFADDTITVTVLGKST